MGKTKEKIPFVLSCRGCDAGDGIDSAAVARRVGWANVGRDVDGMSWNDLGDCPQCQLNDAEQAALSYVRHVWLVIDPAERQAMERFPDPDAHDPAKVLEEVRRLGRDVLEAERRAEKYREWCKKNNVPVLR